MVKELKDGEVRNLPPAWRRSLTESKMRAPTTAVDLFAIAMLVVALAGGATWLAVTGG